MQKNEERAGIIKKAADIGIALNIILGILKMILGSVTHSLAFLSDGANNLTDSISSLVTLVGYRLSKKRPTKSHPLGYGRLEYLSALLVSLLVMGTGVSFLRSSIEAVRNPSPVILTSTAVMILSLSVVVKLGLWLFYRREGRKAGSLALSSSSVDSLSDAVITTVTILSALISHYTSLSLDGEAGIVVSLFIMWSGFESILKVSDTILGKRPSKEEVQKIRDIIKEYPPLSGGYDIRIHSYGPEYSMGTIDVEVPFSSDAESIYEAMEKAKKRLFAETGTLFTFGMNAENQDDERVREMMEKTLKCMKMASGDVIGIHGFHVHFDEKRIEFDVVVSFSLRDWETFRKNMTGLLELIFPGYVISFNIDPDYS